MPHASKRGSHELPIVIEHHQPWSSGTPSFPTGVFIELGAILMEKPLNER